MGSVSQSTRVVFFWLRLLCVVVDVRTAVVVTAASPFSAHVRGHTIGVTIDRSVFFCLLLVCVVVNVLLVVVSDSSPFSAHVCGYPKV